jgi:apolipoprotein N-acyltransferase
MTPDAPAPVAPIPVVDSAGTPRWRPSQVRMTKRRDIAVVPRRGMVAVPALASGVGLALSLPPWGWWILAFPAAGLLWWRLGGLRPRTRLWAGFLAALGCYIPGLMWARSFTVPGALVLIAVESLFVAVGCLAVPAGPLLTRALAFPAALTLAEAARMRWPFGGLPLGGVFLGQAGGPVLGVARLGGPLGLTAAVYVGGVGVGALGEAAARAVRDGRRARVFARVDVAGGAGVAGVAGVAPVSRHPAQPGRGVGPGVGGRGHTIGGAVAGLGALALIGVVALAAVTGTSLIADHAPDGGKSLGTVSVVAVQGGGARGFRKSQINPSVVLAAQMSETRLLAERGATPQLVLWPEDVVSLDTPLTDSPEQSVLSNLARTLKTTLVVGVTETVSTTAFRNEVVAWGPDGRLVSRYEKVHRVPFGEYVPYRSFFSHLANLSAVPLDAVPGTGTGLLPTPAAPLGAMISYEVFYADRGRSSVRDGAQLLIVPTNTSSYATAQVPTQEIAASIIQAVQQGRDLLQAAPTGYSAAITNRGVLLQRSVLGAPQNIFADLSRRGGSTLYVRYGDLPPLTLGALALIAGWYLAGRRGRPTVHDRGARDADPVGR